MITELQCLTESLNEAILVASEPPDAAPLPGEWSIEGPGAPRVIISREDPAMLYTGRTTLTHIARL